MIDNLCTHYTHNMDTNNFEDVDIPFTNVFGQLMTMHVTTDDEGMVTIDFTSSGQRIEVPSGICIHALFEPVNFVVPPKFVDRHHFNNRYHGYRVYFYNDLLLTRPKWTK